MISFEKAYETKNLNEEELEYLNDLISDIEKSLDGECEVKFAISNLCLIARIFDYGRYSFIYPIALSERADEKAALFAVNEYAMREEIARIFTDVPKESLPQFFEIFRHLDVDAEDEYGESFRVKIKTECELLEEIFDFNSEDISLTALTDADTESYAKLCRDDETNKFWGYDFREDFSEIVSDSVFIENAKMEFLRGTAITLAVKRGESFIGEATLYAFNGMGGAELAIRLLPDARGKGFGNKTFYALKEYAKAIGLVRLFAFVDKRNKNSLKYLGNLMETVGEDATRVKFSQSLY